VTGINHDSIMCADSSRADAVASGERVGCRSHAENRCDDDGEEVSNDDETLLLLLLLLLAST